MLSTHGNKLTWMGHATFKITTVGGKVIVVDPWVQSNPMCPEVLKTFDRLDTLLISHGHFDHIADAVELAKKHSSTVVAIHETVIWLQSKGITTVSPMSMHRHNELRHESARLQPRRVAGGISGAHRWKPQASVRARLRTGKRR
jgi:L-ascorbate metabolism protein UlaG (beta-lactamase superfamily)